MINTSGTPRSWLAYHTAPPVIAATATICSTVNIIGPDDRFWRLAAGRAKCDCK